MSTQALTFNHSVHSVFWAGAGALFAVLRTLGLLLGLALGLAGAFALVIAFWVLICQVAMGLVIIAAFAIATYPRTAPRTAVRS